MRIGPYEVVRELGRGGMGVVFRVRAPDGREAALKVLARADAQAFARFERERRLLSTLGEDAGFVGLLDAGATKEGAWLVMPFVPGGTLRARLEVGALTVDETIALGVSLARALGAAHERGIVHRDVKPENILFTASGRPLLADLGLAKHFDRGAKGASQSLTLTREGSFKGTAGYMAPEQLEDAANVGPAADVFALGAVLHECLAGRPAFHAGSVIELLESVRSGRVEPTGRSDAPRWLVSVVQRALAREPGERFADGGRMARALELGGKGAPSGAPGGRDWRALVLTLVLGVALGGAAVVILGRPGAPPGKHASPSQELVDRGNEKAARGDYAGAEHDCSRAIELAPDLAAAWEGRAAARIYTGDHKGAVDDAARAIELAPTFALAWARRGCARANSGDHAGGIADDTKAIELDPKLAIAWAYRGIAFSSKGDDDRSFEDLKKAVELDPKLAIAWVNLGVRWSRLGEIDRAIHDLTLAIELDPKVSLAWTNRGITRSRKPDPQGARDDFTKAIELDPRLAIAWSNRGVVRGQMGDTEGELSDTTRALELNPRSAFALANRGGARCTLGDPSGAIEDETRAIELEPSYAYAWLIRATARYNSGDPAGAIPDLERVIELSPGGSESVTARDLLAKARARAR